MKNINKDFVEDMKGLGKLYLGCLAFVLVIEVVLDLMHWYSHPFKDGVIVSSIMCALLAVNIAVFHIKESKQKK